VPPSLKPVLAAVLSVCLLGATQAASADESADAKSRLEQLGNELGRALGALRERVTERDSLRDRLADAEREVAAVNARVVAAENAAAALARDLEELRTEQTAARERIETQRQALARSLVLASRRGNSDRLVLLLRQQDPTQLARLLRYQRTIADAQAARLGDLHRQLDAFEAREAQIVADAQTLAERRRELASQQQALAKARAERQALLASAEADVDQGQQRVHAIEQDQRELTDLLAQIARREAQARARREQEAAERAAQARARSAKPPAGSPASRPAIVEPPDDTAGPPVSDIPTPGAAGERFSAQRSHLPWPVSGQLRARFGTARESGRTRWDGVVIAARPGTTVRSIHAGKVVYADVLGGYGLLVIVDHGEGYLSLYGYNDAVLKRVGQRVQAGEPIASVGDRGSASGTYFEIRYRGQPVNPSVWCGG
jgi:septal ring factor EnvC (AmiA/AmiB activator)